MSDNHYEGTSTERIRDSFRKVDIADRVRGILVKHSGHSQEAMLADTTLKDDLKLDSLDCIEVGMLLEDEFSIDIPDLDVDRPELGTVGGLIAYVEGRLA